MNAQEYVDVQTDYYESEGYPSDLIFEFILGDVRHEPPQFIKQVEDIMGVLR